VNGAHEPRLLIYSQDGFGLGHQRRTTLLADEFLRSCPGASALTVSDSPLGKFFSSAAGHDYCKLPSVRKIGPGDWRPVSLSSPFADVLDIRRAVLRTTVEAFRPDVLLVDHMPHGAMGELVPTLEALHDEPTVVVLGLRDILDAPAVVRERWRLEGAYEAVEHYYDRVLVYGSPDVFDVATEYGWPDGARSKIQYCGYVCAPPPLDVSEVVRARYPEAADGVRLVVAMAGGGADAYPLFDALLNGVRKIQATDDCRFVLITGPFLPAERRQELVVRAQGLPVDVVASVADPVGYAAAADLVVAMAGYNTTAEILSVGTPAILVPRSGPSAEQQMRARLFAERGWVDWLRPQELSPETLAEAIGTALDGPRTTAPVRPPDLAGRRTGTDRLIESLNETRSPRVVPVAPRRPAPTLLGPLGAVRDDDYLLA
jgi:predicted glycosyltransferase